MLRAFLGFGIVLFGTAYFQFLGWYPNVEWLQRPMVSLWWPLMVLVTCLYVLLRSRHFRPRDPAVAAWVAFGMAGCLLLLPLALAKREQGIHDREFTAYQRQLEEQVRLEQRRREAREADSRPAPEPRPRDRFTQYEGRIDADSLARIRKLDERMRAAMEAQAGAYQAALENHPTRGPDDWVTARSLDDLLRQRDHHRHLYEVARNFTRFVETFEETYTTAIEDLDLRPPADRVAIAELERVLQSWEQGHTYAIRKLDLEVLGAALQALNVLIENWGDWSFSPRDNDLAFSNPADQQRFAQAVQRLQSALQAVQAFREEG